jgi:ankyrin repeat protein
VSALDAFLRAASVPRDTGHTSGTLDEADAILAANPELPATSIHAAAALAEDGLVRRFISQDAASAIAHGGPYEWDPLTYLCFSRYLRLDRSRSDRFVRTARLLLDAGASANTGWFENDHQPKPEWESAVYGAAGIAHHAALTRLLIDHGANPNDEETPYHAPETYDNAALTVLVESGLLTDDSLGTMLLRKADWHDLDGIVYLLEKGVDPNRMTRFGYTALHQALRRDNSLAIVEAMLDHGADPALASRKDGLSGISIAARRGRGDALAAFVRRGHAVDLDGLDALLAACARDDEAGIRSLANARPEVVHELITHGGTPLAEFAGNGNTAGVHRLLDLGVDAAALYETGDGYFGVAPRSTALHVAAWRARHETVAFLIERGAPVNARDARSRTPLALAVLASVDSYWMERRSPASVAALLRAGASTEGVRFPSGYDEVDALLS